MPDYVSLFIRPVSLKEANLWVTVLHRHHRAAQRHKFSICVRDEKDFIRGIAIVGRPISRNLDNGITAEVIRLCTDGTPNACSMLYRACWRSCKAMGYEKIVTYILQSESGISLRAAGWLLEDAACGGSSWSRESREREDKHPLEKKQRWSVSNAQA